MPERPTKTITAPSGTTYKLRRPGVMTLKRIFGVLPEIIDAVKPLEGGDGSINESALLAAMKQRGGDLSRIMDVNIELAKGCVLEIDGARVTLNDETIDDLDMDDLNAICDAIAGLRKEEQLAVVPS